MDAWTTCRFCVGGLSAVERLSTVGDSGLEKPTAYRQAHDSRSTAGKQFVPRKATEADEALRVSFQEVMRFAWTPIDTRRPRTTTTDVFNIQKEI